MMHIVYEHNVYKFVEPRKYPPWHATWLLQFARYGYLLISVVWANGNRILALVYARDVQDDARDIAGGQSQQQVQKEHASE